MNVDKLSLEELLSDESFINYCKGVSPEDIAFWESDIRPPERYLMERFVTAGAQLDLPDQSSLAQQPFINPRIAPLPDEQSLWRPTLRMLSLDIETSMDAKQLYSIGVWCEQGNRVFMVGEGSDTELVIFCDDEKSCLQQFFIFLQQ